MPTITEMPMQDASAGLDTTYSFMPDAKGSYNDRSDNNMFNGEIGEAGDEDWIAITLKAGTVYTITVATRHTNEDMDEGGLNDSILTILDSKGVPTGIMNDDIDGLMGMLNSEVEFTPEVDAVYHIAVSAYSANPNVDNLGAYTVTVTESDPPDPNVGVDIPGTAANDKLIGTDLNEKINGGTGGDDSLYGMGGDDTLQGGIGNDLLVGGPGADILQGGGDNDTISYKSSPDGVRVNLETGTARGGDAGGDSFGDPDADEYDNDIENVQGSMHDDDITGDAEGNKIWGYAGDDELNGGDGDDTLDGGMGDDELDGGDGVDTLIGGGGADELTGGDGDDTASWAGSMAGVTVRLHNSRAMGGDAEGDTFAGTTTYEHEGEDEDGEPVDVESSAPDIIHITGSAHADILAGDGRANTIKGGGGDDTLYGGPGGDPSTNGDILEGEDGNDMLFGGAGADTLDGGAGNDVLKGGAGADTYRGGAGNDMIYADKADIGDAENVREAGSIDGGEDPADPDNADAPGDSDTVTFENFTAEDGGVEADLSLNGGLYNGIENLIGTDFVDTFSGHTTENNTIEGGDGGDILSGGGSPGDTLSYASSDGRVIIDLSDGQAANGIARGNHATGDTISGFENVIGTDYDDFLTGRDTVASKLWGGAGNDELVGGSGGDTLDGGAGDDELSGHAGSDTVEGGAGADMLDGGTADGVTDGDDTDADTLSYASSTGGVTVNLATAGASGGHANGDEIAVNRGVYDHDMDDETTELDVATFENVTGSDHHDSLSGDHRFNVLKGGGGDDSLRGGGDADHLVGGPGADRLDGGSSLSAGADTEDDDTDDVQDIDWAVYRPATAGVTVNLDTNMGTGGDAMGDTLVNIELIWGSMHDDTFIASSGNDYIHGDIQGDDGNGDTVSYETSRMGVTVNLVTDQDGSVFDGTQMPSEGALGGAIDMLDDAGDVTTVADDNVNGAAGDRLGGIENLTGSAQDDDLTGDGNANTLKGEGGDDELDGAGGNDTLDGGAGEDELTGGTGDDMLSGGGDDDVLNGDAGMDTLNGGAGDDTMDGGADSDTLNGGTGDDDMTGSGGNDTFVIGLDNGHDYITDFDGSRTDTNPNGDVINLEAFDSITSFDDLTIKTRGGSVVIDLSNDGGGSITLTGTVAETDLSADDFVFVA